MKKLVSLFLVVIMFVSLTPAIFASEPIQDITVDTEYEYEILEVHVSNPGMARCEQRNVTMVLEIYTGSRDIHPSMSQYVTQKIDGKYFSGNVYTNQLDYNVFTGRWKGTFSGFLYWYCS